MAKANSDARQNIRVFVRVRPTLSLDTFSRSVLEFPSESEVTVRDNVKGKISDRVTKTFRFNRVFNPQATQAEVYKDVVKPLLEEVLQGYSCTVFAYGQTGTGKTFTMEGEHLSDTSSWGSDPNAGIIPRTLSELFDRLRLGDANYAVRISFLELYNEELIDLLSAPEDTTRLRLFEDSTKKGAVIISGLEEVEVCTKADVYKILEKGSLKRQTASTLMNAHSSRSHTVFTATVYIREKAENDDGQDVLRTGKINLVDLAGSENIGRSGAIEKRAREAGNINQSLLTLGRVITALVDQSAHVPYRESKLTRLLQESLGGRTKTSIIATVSPTVSNYEETLSTLEYAHRAKNIQNKPEINQRLSKKLHLAEYTEEIERLHRDLEATRQRTGVFLHQSEYDELLRQLDCLAQESSEKVEQIKGLNEQKVKQETLCNELSKKLEVVGAALEKEEAALAAEKSALLGLQLDLEKTRCEEREQTHLVARHWETAQEVKTQETELRSVAELTSTKSTLLHDKLDRVRCNAVTRENLAVQMQIRVAESIDLGVDLVESSAKENLEMISAVSSLLDSGLDSVKETWKARKDAVSSLLEDEEKAIESYQKLAEEQSEREAAWAAEFRDVINVGKQSAGAVDGWHLDVLKPSLMKGREQMIKVGADIKGLVSKSGEVDAWREVFRRAVVDAILQMLSAPLEEILPTLTKELEEFENVKADTSVLKGKHRVLMKSLRGELSKMKESVEVMRASSKDWRDVAEAKRATIASSGAKYYSGAASLTNATEKLLTQGNAELLQNKERFTEQIVKLCKECCNSVNEWDTSDQFGDVAPSFQNVLESGRAAWHAQNAATIRLIEDASQLRDETSQLLNGCLQELETRVEECASKNSEGLDKISTGLSALTIDVRSLTSKYHDKFETWTASLKQIVTECNDEVHHFVNGDYLETVPTGQTPQRENVNYPRDLRTTSPHERILGRFRQKMLQTKTAEDESPEIPKNSISPPSLLAVDSSSEIDEGVKNKENNDSFKESPLKVPDKKPRSRKPLVSQN